MILNSSLFIRLEKLIEKASTECLNQNLDFGLNNVLYQPNLDLELRSLDDEQLLIRIPFSSVKEAIVLNFDRSL